MISSYCRLQNQEKRNKAYDFLKLYAMLSVVLDHSLQHLIGEEIQTTQLYNWIFLSQMPVFMFVSGYFSLSNLFKDASIHILLKKLKKICASYGIPFISYSIIVSLLTRKLIVFKSFLFPNYSLWFLWSLLWMQIIMNLSQQITKSVIKNPSIRYFISIVLYLIGMLPFAVLYIILPEYFDSKLIIYYSVFYIFGYIYAFFENKYDFTKSVKFKVLSIPILILIVTAIMLKHPVMIFDPESITNILYRLYGSFAAILLLLYLSFFAVRIKIFERISVLGQLSLELYYVHLLIIRFPLFNSSGVTWVEFVAKYIVLVSLSLFIVVLLKSNKYTDFIIFGKCHNMDKR